MEIIKFWGLAQKYLQSEMEVRNWTAFNEFLDTKTFIQKVFQDKIIILTQNRRKAIPLDKEDFHYVLSVWKEYLSGRISRSEMRWKSYKLTYLLA